MLLQCQRACSGIWGDWAENNHEIRAEVRGNYPNFKQNSGERKFCHLKSQWKPAVVWQMLFQSSEVPKIDNCVLSNEQRVGKQKSSRKTCFLDNFSQITQLDF